MEERTTPGAIVAEVPAPAPDDSLTEGRAGAGGHQGRRAKKPRWHGILGGEDRNFRLMCAVCLLIAFASLAFMQFGFIGLGVFGHYDTYVMTPLAFLAAAALLLGPRSGTLFGLCCGIIFGLHAHMQPLDVYERFLVGPLNSIVLLTVCGLLLGLLFKTALRNDPQGFRRWFYLGICCFIVAALATILFFVNSLIDSVITILAGDELLTSILRAGITDSPQLLALLTSIGGSAFQMPFDFAIMLLACAGAEAIARLHAIPVSQLRLGAQFQSWLLVVVVLAQMATSAILFVITTKNAKTSAFARMDGEIEYLGRQLSDHRQIEDSVVSTIQKLREEGKEVPEEIIALLESEAKLTTILDGYDKESDGSIAIFQDDVIILTTDAMRYPIGYSMQDIFGPKARNVLTSLANGTKRDSRSVFDKGDGRTKELLYDDNLISFAKDGSINLNTEGSQLSTQISYVRAGMSGPFTIIVERPSSMIYSDRAGSTLRSSLSAMALLVTVYFLASGLLRRLVVDGIDSINGGLTEITSGKLDTHIDVKSSAEFLSLSSGVNTTVDALKGWIHEAETRMDRELATAKAIQASALPRTFPPFPEIDKFDIYASMNPAKEVGGDFYDFFLIDDHTLGFLIADVSGKGIPGALFMMTAKTEIENHMMTGMPVEQAIAGVNARLCANNDADMFVTVWAAKLDYDTGELTYVNAGHNPPLMRHNGSWEWLTKKGGLFVGTFATAKYRSSTLTLEKGDEILLYTDGVNEAFSADEEEYGNDRLEAFLGEHADEHPRELVENLKADVAAWAKGTEQSDDITMVSLEYGEAPEVSGTITLPAVLDNLPALMKEVQDVLSERLCPIDVQHKVEVALEEMLVNVCRYAYADKDEPGKVRLSYVYRGNPASITVEIVDQGVPFDPLTRKDPTKPANIQEAKVGGLGIFMTKKSVDEITYLRSDGNNILAFRKDW